jgi:hypothetical protein
MSSPPQLLRLLPAGAVAGWDLHPLESAALSRRTPGADIAKLAVNIVRFPSEGTIESAAGSCVPFGKAAELRFLDHRPSDCGDSKRACTCGGAGMPSRMCNEPAPGERPRMPPGFTPRDDADIKDRSTKPRNAASPLFGAVVLTRPRSRSSARCG